LAVNATEYYASKQIETGNPLYAVAGSASALMLPENQDKTELVLSLGASLPPVIEGGASLLSAMRRSGARDIDEVTTMRSGFDAPDKFGSAADHIYDDMRPLADEFPELVGVNPHYVPDAPSGVNTNCISCANATQQRLLGTDPYAAANPSGGRNRK
jgi:hypothetical protein